MDNLPYVKFSWKNCSDEIPMSSNWILYISDFVTIFIFYTPSCKVGYWKSVPQVIEYWIFWFPSAGDKPLELLFLETVVSLKSCYRTADRSDSKGRRREPVPAKARGRKQSISKQIILQETFVRSVSVFPAQLKTTIKTRGKDWLSLPASPCLATFKLSGYMYPGA